MCIVSQDPLEGYAPLVVGESIRRYSLKSELWIDMRCEGINYKSPETYSSPKILVRKTGVGISAALDYTEALTNQVVYIFRHRLPTLVSLPLEFYLGVLNSRVMYYYVTKTHGETEWRSHPYLTQRQILDLPLPLPESFTSHHNRIAMQIAKSLRPFLSRQRDVPDSVDAKVERLVAELYGMTRRDYKHVYATLNAVEELLPVRALKSVRPSDIFP